MAINVLALLVLHSLLVKQRDFPCLSLRHSYLPIVYTVHRYTGVYIYAFGTRSAHVAQPLISLDVYHLLPRKVVSLDTFSVPHFRHRSCVVWMYVSSGLVCVAWPEKDLFPGLEVPSNDYGEFSVALEEQLDKHGLQKVCVCCVDLVLFACPPKAKNLCV